MTFSAYIDRHAPDIVRTLQKVVRIPTVNPPGKNYEAVTAVLRDELASAGLSARRYEIPSKLLKQTLPRELQAYPRYNVLGKLAAPGAKKTIHFNAHYDVVPVSGKWRHGDPFSGAVDDGWIYGRGT